MLRSLTRHCRPQVEPTTAPATTSPGWCTVRVVCDPGALRVIAPAPPD